MRVTIIKQATNLTGVTAELLKAGVPAAKALARLKALNPHVDPKRVTVGTVLVLPDLAEMKAGVGEAVGAETFEQFAAEIAAGFKAASGRLRAGAKRRKDERDAVDGAVKTAAVKRVIASDAALRTQLADAERQSKADERQAKEAAKTMETMRDLAAKELQGLRTLFE